MPNSARLRRLVVAALVSTTALAAVGCSSTSSDKPDVPSLGHSGGPAASDKSASGSKEDGDGGDADRPRYKLNMTQEEEEAVQAPYVKCMIDHGVVSARDRKMGTKQATDEPQKTLEAAQKACAAKVPLPAWESDPKNPAALDFNRKVVSCLRGKGVREVEVTQADGQINVAFGGPDNDQQSINLGMQYLPDCQREVSQAH